MRSKPSIFPLAILAALFLAANNPALAAKQYGGQTTNPNTQEDSSTSPERGRSTGESERGSQRTPSGSQQRNEDIGGGRPGSLDNSMPGSGSQSPGGSGNRESGGMGGGGNNGSGSGGGSMDNTDR